MFQSHILLQPVPNTHPQRVWQRFAFHSTDFHPNPNPNPQRHRQRFTFRNMDVYQHCLSQQYPDRHFDAHAFMQPDNHTLGIVDVLAVPSHDVNDYGQYYSHRNTQWHFLRLFLLVSTGNIRLHT